MQEANFGGPSQATSSPAITPQQTYNQMKFIKSAAAAVITSGILASSIFAGDSATQTVNFEVEEINELAFDGTINLTIDSAVAGEAPIDATDDSSGTYAITTNETGRKITAALDQAMPNGVTLKVSLTAPSGATSTEVTLGTSAADAVTGISTLNQAGLGVSYTLSASPSAGVVSGTRVVTYTITE